MIYSGIHYDVLATNDELSTENKDTDVAQWSTGDVQQEEDILAASQNYVSCYRVKIMQQIQLHLELDV